MATPLKVYALAQEARRDAKDLMDMAAVVSPPMSPDAKTILRQQVKKLKAVVAALESEVA